MYSFDTLYRVTLTSIERHAQKSMAVYFITSMNLLYLRERKKKNSTYGSTCMSSKLYFFYRKKSHVNCKQC